MDNKSLEAFARKAPKSINSQSDFEDLHKMLTKMTGETAVVV